MLRPRRPRESSEFGQIHVNRPGSPEVAEEVLDHDLDVVDAGVHDDPPHSVGLATNPCLACLSKPADS